MVEVDGYCRAVLLYWSILSSLLLPSVAWNVGIDNSITSSQSQSQVFVGFLSEKVDLTGMMTHVLGRN